MSVTIFGELRYVLATRLTAHLVAKAVCAVLALPLLAVAPAGALEQTESCLDAPSAQGTLGFFGMPRTAQASDSTDVTVTWPAAVGGNVVRYELWANRTLVGSVDGAASSYVAKGQLVYTDLRFVVCAFTDDGLSAWTPATIMRIVDKPSAPVSVTAVAGAGSATVSWVPPATDNGLTIYGYQVVTQPGGETRGTQLGSAAFEKRELTIGNLKGGETYTFTVYAKNDRGWGPGTTSSPTVPNPATEADQGDPTTKSPETSIIRGLENVRRPARSKYTFSARMAVPATFECRLDKHAWKACTSPYLLKTKKLGKGKHLLRVRAVSSGGRDQSPSKKYIRVR